MEKIHILLSPTCKRFCHAIEVCNFNQLIQEEIFCLVEKHMKQFIFLSPRTSEWYCCITRGTCNNSTCTIYYCTTVLGFKTVRACLHGKRVILVHALPQQWG